MPSFPPLRRYQQKAVEDIHKKLGSRNPVICSICPSGGKTLIGLSVGQVYLDLDFTVLVLTHGTLDLQNQWVEDVAKYAMGCDRLLIHLPHQMRQIEAELTALAEHGHPLGLLIVDEAHHFYLADMVQEIRRRFKPTRELLLTGTPSTFIYENQQTPDAYQVCIVSGCDVHKEGLAAEDGPYIIGDLYTCVVATTYPINEAEDRIANGNLKEEVVLAAKDTEVSMEQLMDALIARLNRAPDANPTLQEFNDLAHTTRGPGRWGETYHKLSKTLIVARSKEQALDIHHILVEKGVNAVVSEHIADRESAEIKAFRKHEEIAVLVVVNRANLGFNMPTLVAVVDFRCTRNIDSIYQLMARVFRPDPGDPGRKKLFVKMGTGENPRADAYYLEAALCMNNLSFIQAFNGYNLGSMDIITKSKPKTPKPRDPFADPKEQHRGHGHHTSTVVNEIVFDDVISLELLAQLATSSRSKLWNEYAYVNLGDALKVLEHVTLPRSRVSPDLNFKRAKAHYTQHHRFPSATSSDPKEAALGRWFKGARGQGPSHKRKDDVVAWAISVELQEDYARRITDLKQHFLEHQRLPSPDLEPQLEFFFRRNQADPEIQALVHRHFPQGAPS